MQEAPETAPLKWQHILSQTFGASQITLCSTLKHSVFPPKTGSLEAVPGSLEEHSANTSVSRLCSPSAPRPACIVYFPPSATDQALPFWEPKSHPLWLSPLGHKCSWAAGICFVNRQLKWRRKKKSLLTLHSQSPKTAVLRVSILHIMRRFWGVLSTLVSKELNWRQGEQSTFSTPLDEATCYWDSHRFLSSEQLVLRISKEKISHWHQWESLAHTGNKTLWLRSLDTGAVFYSAYANYSYKLCK